jgi:hypothetical protein
MQDGQDGKQRSDMNLGRGLIRLWLVAALIWILGSGWVLRGNLLADCNRLFRIEENDATPAIDCRLEKIAALGNAKSGWPLGVQIRATEWVVIPPLVVLAIGGLGFWVVRGFPTE